MSNYVLIRRAWVSILEALFCMRMIFGECYKDQNYINFS